MNQTKRKQILTFRLLLPLIIVGIAWLQESIDQLFFSGSWNLPLGPGLPWWGLLTAPFSHAGFGHLISNTIMFLPLSWLVLTKGYRDYIAVLIAVVVMEIPVWLFWPRGSHGMSGVIYGLLGYLLLIGFLESSLWAIILSIICLILFGNYLTALIPGVSPAGVSWIGHASGFLGGIFAALAISGVPSENATSRY
ncbi:rhomboid family intramembrane serine protease [Prochlorococcus marinus]|uniref:rhomboid family intramembrane serine protease n=1 Tax=Prochlorococcus marinus TaxID=1219 RepID=UPI0007BC0C48|nr:rhomboid family intramembrane serine protease [Prochlorococcus marinus]KZR70353.1 Rhomboid family protein [Prochlorococcus marinus str. MIT 1312]KZR79465.1 Rhomboid family protein [Prochlorococcus marinus str. MIT 1327]